MAKPTRRKFQSNKQGSPSEEKVRGFHTKVEKGDFVVPVHHDLTFPLGKSQISVAESESWSTTMAPFRQLTVPASAFLFQPDASPIALVSQFSKTVHALCVTFMVLIFVWWGVRRILSHRVVGVSPPAVPAIKISTGCGSNKDHACLPGGNVWIFPQKSSLFHQWKNRESDALTSSPRSSGRFRSKDGFEKAGLTGLRNIGNTCFMNTVLQCLSNTRPLLEYVMGHYDSDINRSTSGMKGALMRAFGELIHELWRDQRVVDTSAFKDSIQRFAPRFMGYSQQDAQEFLRYLLEGLHEDVNRVTAKPTPITTDIDESLSDGEKATESWRRYMRYESSRIVDMFVGQFKSTLKCTVCGHCSVTFDPFWDLSLPIPSRSSTVRLSQCFELLTKEEVLDGEEKPTCAKCQCRRKCTKSLAIQKFPKILVVHLKRFSLAERYRGKLSTLVDYPLNGLDLTPFSSTRGNVGAYNLYGVANHSGSTYSGHYIAYCKHPYSNEWHCYNDSRVSPISSHSVVSPEGYVLFYEQVGQSSLL